MNTTHRNAIEELQRKLRTTQDDLRLLLLAGGNTALTRDDIKAIEHEIGARIAAAESEAAARSAEREAECGRQLDRMGASIANDINLKMAALEPPAPISGVQ